MVLTDDTFGWLLQVKLDDGTECAILLAEADNSLVFFGMTSDDNGVIIVEGHSIYNAQAFELVGIIYLLGQGFKGKTDVAGIVKMTVKVHVSTTQV